MKIRLLFSRVVIFCLLIAAVVACNSSERSDIKKKRMPDLHFVEFQTEQENEDFEASIARALELYATDPGAFGDPMGTIDSLTDSLSFRHPTRSIALVLVNPDWNPPEGIVKGRISGGWVLSMQFDQGFGGLDSCWNEILNYSQSKNYRLVAPAIEIYRGYDSELTSAAIELIIRIR